MVDWMIYFKTRFPWNEIAEPVQHSIVSADTKSDAETGLLKLLDLPSERVEIINCERLPW